MDPSSSRERSGGGGGGGGGVAGLWRDRSPSCPALEYTEPNHARAKRGYGGGKWGEKMQHTMSAQSIRRLDCCEGEPMSRNESDEGHHCWTRARSLSRLGRVLFWAVLLPLWMVGVLIFFLMLPLSIVYAFFVLLPAHGVVFSIDKRAQRWKIRCLDLGLCPACGPESETVYSPDHSEHHWCGHKCQTCGTVWTSSGNEASTH
jgi:hypothetical protein